VIELDGLAENVVIAAELFLPEKIAEDSDRSRCAVGDVGRREASAKEERNAHEVEEIGGISANVNRDRELIAGQIASVTGLEEEVLNRRGSVKLWGFRAVDNEKRAVSGFVAELDVHHAVGVLIRIGVKQNGVDDAENGGGGADAEGKREDGGEDKARRLAELAEGEANVL
jgi:hypothetical protein